MSFEVSYSSTMCYENTQKNNTWFIQVPKHPALPGPENPAEDEQIVTATSSRLDHPLPQKKHGRREKPCGVPDRVFPKSFYWVGEVRLFPHRADSGYCYNMAQSPI